MERTHLRVQFETDVSCQVVGMIDLQKMSCAQVCMNVSQGFPKKLGILQKVAKHFIAVTTYENVFCKARRALAESCEDFPKKLGKFSIQMWKAFYITVAESCNDSPEVAKIKSVEPKSGLY